MKTSVKEGRNDSEKIEVRVNELLKKVLDNKSGKNIVELELVDNIEYKKGLLNITLSLPPSVTSIYKTFKSQISCVLENELPKVKYSVNRTWGSGYLLFKGLI
jgi:metal-sulfur cluster biosynthetic enzyme